MVVSLFLSLDSGGQKGEYMKNTVLAKVKAFPERLAAVLKQKPPVVLTLLKAILLCVICGIFFVLSIFIVSGAIVDRESESVYPYAEGDNPVAAEAEYDCILVLGCGVRADGSPTDRLYDRVTVGVQLYFAGAAPKLLMSGDHGREDYDEVTAMRDLAISMGVPKEDIFLDHAGFSTYESMYRAKAIFSCERIVVVSQEYHLYRACYIAKAFGVHAVGVSADLRPYAKQTYYELREKAARFKDFFFSVLKPDPTYLGDPIDLSDDGSVTHEPEA